MDITSLLNPRPTTPLPLLRLEPLFATSLALPESLKAKRTKSELTRDQRIQVKTLRGIGWTYEEISKHLTSLEVKCSIRQAWYTEKYRNTSQKTRCGPKSLLDTPKRKRIIDFIISSRKNRRMPLIKVS